MQRMAMACAALTLLAGCAQPPASDEPKANGAYLIIEGRQAWAVVIADGKRSEERGVVVDTIRLPKAHSPIAASYLIDTPNCGKLQWLATGTEDSAESSVFLSATGGQADLSRCGISGGLSRMWTTLDYSG